MRADRSQSESRWSIGARSSFLARNDVRLVLTSGLILFVELLLIRWVPANVTYVGFFSNFLLMASFLGIGLGILLGRRLGRIPASPFAPLLFIVVLLVHRAQLNVQVAARDEIFFGLSESRSADINFLVLPLVGLLVTALLAALALPLGPLFRSMPPLRAYRFDIIGSLAGIAGFTVLSALGTSPIVWFTVVAGCLLLLALGSGFTIWSAFSGVSMVAVIYATGVQASPYDIWSPYYRVSAFPNSIGTTSINVNGIGHQMIWPVANQDKEPFYDQVYRWFPGRQFDRVLIVGAGTGTDTAIALAQGAEHVDAVEIDPVIQRLGVERNPDRPYEDARVARHTNDGRAFLRTSTDTYDLVVFALPDSLTLVSTAANLRLESFLFTEEAFTSVKDHLEPNGVFVLYNYYREPWLVEKLARMLETTFEVEPLLRLHNPVVATLAAVNTTERATVLPRGADEVDRLPALSAPAPRVATDDWPFLYLRQPSIAPYYLAAIGALLVAATVAIGAATRVTRTPLQRFSPHFFVLGAAFLLLETRSLATFSLLFGTTWLVNSLAFFAILVSVLLAILVASRFPRRRSAPLYLALFGSLALAFALPPETLLVDSPVVRYAVAATLTFAPVFFANLVFAYSFRETLTADMAFASNLLGAMIGGAIEYAALLTGHRSLLLAVAGLYALAYVFAVRWRMLADADLSAEDGKTVMRPRGFGRRSPAGQLSARADQ